MKHIITATDVPNDDYKLKVGDLVEFIDSDGTKHNMVVIPECVCSKCCLGDKMARDSIMRVCSVLNDQYSICYNGTHSGASEYVSFTYIDNILEHL